jgi:translation elongation factor P/translation initiation factor 5A
LHEKKINCYLFHIVLNLSDEAYQYLYSEGEKIHLLNLESFEEIEMTASTCEGSVSMLEGNIYSRLPI